MNLATKLLLASMCGVLIFGCSFVEEASNLSWLKNADPKRDCKAAIARGDTRFYAVNGYAADMILGVSQYGADQKLVQTHGFRTIGGTSDTSTGKLNQCASEYARRYNEILRSYLYAKAGST